ncbi:hypothetical protein JYU34_006133 [Plutella xylostella]|uniref:Uncharacterized protein n=1 Tax=Plutella xylostella TaxID=51655 RepID=A0ABQ7QV45_PLUXY|nr:hypothetical protein JYU34_006133 [Plutella xylostella]
MDTLGDMQHTEDETSSNNTIEYFFNDTQTNRKELFKEALSSARNGKVLYILHEEFTELPELSQDLASVNRHYMKMISFLYAKSLTALIEIISTLSDWQNIPFTIIVENLNDYCPKDKLQNACGVVALLIDSIQRCSKALGVPCKLLISIDKDIGEENCNIMKELYSII